MEFYNLEHLSLWFSMICVAIFILLLSLVLYVFFYRPMAEQFVKMRELALNDMLTGLYNRRGFMTFASQLLKLSHRTQRGLILIYADLDNLKQVNDDGGHEMGDKALVSVAEVFRETFRNSDVIGRIGGDEFAILALEAQAGSLEALRKRLNENLERSQYNLDSVHKLTFSLGIIYYNPKDRQTIEELLGKADMLMYEEKSFRAVFPLLSSQLKDRISTYHQ